MRNEDAQAGFRSSRHNTAVAHGRERGDPEFPSEQARLTAAPPRSRAAACTGAGLAGVRKEITVRRRPVADLIGQGRHTRSG